MVGIYSQKLISNEDFSMYRQLHLQVTIISLGWRYPLRLAMNLLIWGRGIHVEPTSWKTPIGNSLQIFGSSPPLQPTLSLRKLKYTDTGGGRTWNPNPSLILVLAMVDETLNLRVPSGVWKTEKLVSLWRVGAGWRCLNCTHPIANYFTATSDSLSSRAPDFGGNE